MNLSDLDRRIVEQTLLNVHVDTVPALKRIHSTAIAANARRRQQLTDELAGIDRAIAMRTYALERLAELLPRRVSS